ncbi:MAG: M48 family metalloprotease [bacterium]|nr:M48 family metalloprotease [bacterium]
MPHLWQKYRYRGDAADVKELFEAYRVGDFLDAFDENRRRHDEGVREQLLQHGIRLSERLSPRIFGIHEQVCRALEIEGDAEIFCLPDRDVNAFAILDVREGKTHMLVGMTAGALEELDDAELASIIGHELGHFLFEHNRMNALLNLDPEDSASTVLPPFGESLFLRWRKKAEISSDRAGLLACRDFRASARALLKATFGLSEKNLNLDVDALLQQIGEIESSPELMGSVFSSHPLLPIRLKALQLFARSEQAVDCGCQLEGERLTLDQVEDEIDNLMNLTRRHPVKPLPVAVMKAVALGGANVMGADHTVSDNEVKLLVRLLHAYFTDEPETVIETDRARIEKQLPDVLKTIKEDGGEEEIVFLLTQVARVAYADGALSEAESAAILALAEQLEYPADRTYPIIVGAAQSAGAGADVTLNRIADELRQSFMLEIRAERQPQRPLWI